MGESAATPSSPQIVVNVWGWLSRPRRYAVELRSSLDSHPHTHEPGHYEQGHAAKEAPITALGAGRWFAGNPSARTGAPAPFPAKLRAGSRI